ncbi:MAG: dehypoxanthine futalosine cyclase [Candidatus Omnitrophica bacterium]|nr:dehypoxanthine futalosine cyclase [Candidatus Omnitrophota bacterium]
MNSDATAHDAIAGAVAQGRRLTRGQGRFLLEEAELLDLAGWAAAVRQRLHPGKTVTFVLDANPNYTNICKTDCLFCAFYRKPGDRDAYTLSVEEVLARVGRLRETGMTTVLLQGGHNELLPLEYYLDIVRGITERYPDVTPHCFTASEIRLMAEVSGKSLQKVVQALYEAGQRTLPGGGAEVLSERVRRKIARKKGGPETWLEVHEIAHQAGMRSTATLMYGHVETTEDLLDHFDVIRDLQDRTGGFTAFIPWSFKPGNTPLEKAIPRHATSARYLRMMAVSRLYLDNVDHIQASWFSEGKKTGQIALRFGADDFGGTLLEENVHRAADFVNTSTAAEVAQLIREAGFEPAQRTTLYEIIKKW